MTIKLPRIFTTQAQWLEQQQTSILSAASIITVTSIISAFSGLIVKRSLIGMFFNTQLSKEALEAFWVAFQIPDMMFQLIILGALSAAFIPIFTSYKKNNQDQAFYISSVMMNVLLLTFVIVGVLIAIFAQPITLLRTGEGFTAHQVEIVTNLTRIMILAQLFFAVSNFMTGILQSFQRFIIPALAPIFYNLGILLGVFLFSNWLGIYSAGVGVVIGAGLHMLIQLPLVFKLGFKYHFSFNLSSPGVREFFKLMPPRVLALGASETRKLFLGYFATSLGNISYTIMFLATSLMVIPIRFFGISISQASLPFLSEESSGQDRDKFKGLVMQSLHQIAFLTFPASVLLLILRIPVVRLIFGTSNFPWPATLTTGKVVALLAISITAQALTQLLIRAFYSLKDTKTPFWVSMVDLAIYLALAGGLVFWTDLGVYGLAIATAASALIELPVYLFLMDRRVKGFIRREFWLPQFKMLVASFFMAVFLYLPFKILDELVFDTSRTIELIGLTVTTSTIGILVYIYFALLLDIRELNIFLKLVNDFTPWKKTLAKTPEVVVENPTDGTDAL